MNLKILPVAAVLTLTVVLSERRGEAQPCRSRLAAEVNSFIQQSYGGSLESPKTTFRKRVPPPPVRDMVNALRGMGYEIGDPYVDLGLDNSFNYSVKRDGKAWRLCVSMVGPYAVLFRLGRDEQLTLLADVRPPTLGHEIKKVVSDGKYTLLDRATLSCATDLKLEHTVTAGRPVRFWQALVRDESELPWEPRRQR